MNINVTNEIMENRLDDQNIQKTRTNNLSSSELSSASTPAYTIADLQRSPGLNGPIIIGNTTLAEKEEIFNEIFMGVKKNANRKFWCPAALCSVVSSNLNFCTLFLLRICTTSIRLVESGK